MSAIGYRDDKNQDAYIATIIPSLPIKGDLAARISVGYEGRCHGTPAAVDIGVIGTLDWASLTDLADDALHS